MQNKSLIEYRLDIVNFISEIGRQCVHYML